MKLQRHLNKIDTLFSAIENAFTTLVGEQQSHRAYATPAQAETILPEALQKKSGQLMRVNHSGEVAAQALYLGQAFTSTSPDLQEKLHQAAEEERDHLAWCAKRLTALNTHQSALNPIWYSGAFVMGAVAGLISDTFSLSFLAETERQVGEHLTRHLDLLPSEDHESRAVIETMREDEAHHEQTALANGGQAMSKPIQILMQFTSKAMTTSSFYI